MRRPFIQKVPNAGLEQGMIAFADAALHKYSQHSSFMSIFNVKYIVHRKDVSPYPGAVLNFWPLEADVVCHDSFGKVYFYAIPDKYFVPHIYPTVVEIRVDSDAQINNYLRRDDFFSYPMPVFLRDYAMVDGVSIRREDTPAQRSATGVRHAPKIIFKKINPTKYEIKIIDAKDPFWLVFSEGYHEFWNLYIDDQTGPNACSLFDVVKESARLGVKEARHEKIFTPGDVRFFSAA